MAEDNIKIKKVDITPDISLLPKLGNSGYKLAEALAEFIDNSLDARLPEQKSVKVNISISEKRVSVEDNSSGMNEEETINSLKLGFSIKKDKLGEFGLGMKTAATSLGKRFTLKTSRKGDKNWYVLDYDEESWKENLDWKSQELKVIPKNNKREYGTSIIIQDLKFKYYPNLVTNTKRELSFRFAPYLENKLLEINVNTGMLEPIEPELIGGKVSIDIAIDKEKSITGWYGILKKRNALKYGFNLYKHGRLIRAEEKFGFEAHAEVALLYGNINIDFVPTTHNKREFIENSFEYRQAEEKFRNYLKDNKVTVKAREFSKKISEQKKREKIEKEVGDLFGSTLKFLNEPNRVDEIKKEKPSREIIEKDEIDKIKLLYNDKEFNLGTLEEGNIYDLRILGKKFTFKFDLIPLGKEKDTMKYFRENNHIIILINSDFPFYEYIVKDYGLYSLFLISEVISEVLVNEFNLESDQLLHIRNLMLRKYGETQKGIVEIENIEEEKRKLLEKMKKLEEKEKSFKSG